jgi:hypothetical protein
MKRGDLIRHLKEFGCVFKREGAGHSLWIKLEKWKLYPDITKLKISLPRRYAEV